MREGHHSDRGLAARQLADDPIAVCLVEPEALVPEMADRTATHEPDEQARRRDHREHEADPGTLAGAARAELGLLDMTLLVESEDPDRAHLHLGAVVVPLLE